MAASFDKYGVQFLYPENWKLTDQVDQDMPYQVSLETPEGGMWSLNLFPADSDPESVLADVMEALHAQYEDIETTVAEEDFGETHAKGIDAFFYCLDFMVMAQIRIIQSRDYLMLVWFQAENREFDEQQMVFRAITVSMLQSLTNAKAQG